MPKSLLQLIELNTLHKLEKLLENPVIEPLDEIIERFYLGSRDQAINPLLLSNYQITHIVNVCHFENIFEYGVGFALRNCQSMGLTLLSQVVNLVREYAAPKYLKIPIADRTNVNISRHFYQSFQFIQTALQNQNNRVLVHCHAGVSRSATIVIAYLMYSQKWTLDQAYLHVKSKRDIHPNRGFVRQLLEFHYKISKQNQKQQGANCIMKQYNLKPPSLLKRIINRISFYILSCKVLT